MTEEPEAVQQEETEEDGDPEPVPVLPIDDTPLPPVQWMCTTVDAVSLKRKASETHMLDVGSRPTQPTTDARGRYMSGPCPSCGCTTIWKKVTL